MDGAVVGVGGAAREVVADVVLVDAAVAPDESRELVQLTSSATANRQPERRSIGWADI